MCYFASQWCTSAKFFQCGENVITYRNITLHFILITCAWSSPIVVKPFNSSDDHLILADWKPATSITSWILSNNFMGEWVCFKAMGTKRRSITRCSRTTGMFLCSPRLGTQAVGVPYKWNVGTTVKYVINLRSTWPFDHGRGTYPRMATGKA